MGDRDVSNEGWNPLYDTLKNVGKHIAAGGPTTQTDRQALLAAIENALEAERERVANQYAEWEQRRNEITGEL